MLVENEVRVPVSVETAWSHLLDVERVVGCIPGAELTEAVDDRTWQGTMKVKLGPMSLLFAGTVRIDERDEPARRLVLRADGKDRRGKGSGTLVATSMLEQDADATVIKIHQDISVSGAIAQFGRGVMEDVVKRILADFADCLSASMATETAAAPTQPADASVAERPAAREPVKGLRLLLSAVLSSLRRLRPRRGAAR